MKKLGLVLGSGGSRGIAHVGFLKALDEHEIKPYCIAGCSMGSVVGGLYAKGMTPDEMMGIVRTLKGKDIIDLNMAPLTSKALLKTAKMTKIIDGLFGNVTFEELKITFMCNAFDINKGKTVWFSKGEVAPCVRASSSIPLVFNPVPMEDKLLVDGGANCRMPYKAAKKMGADVIVGVDVLGKLRKSYKNNNLITYAIRVIDAVDWSNTEASYKRDRYDLLLMPELGSMSQYVIKNLEKAYEKGYELGIRHIEEIKALLD